VKPGCEGCQVLEDLKKRLDAVKRETGAAITELAGKVERMQRKATAKFSPVREQRNQTAASSPAVDSELAVGSIPKQARKRRGDAFDQSQNPGAPREFFARWEALPTAASTNARLFMSPLWLGYAAAQYDFDTLVH
jgi:hypothetical protein